MRKQRVIPLVLEEFLVLRIEAFRQKLMKKSGHMSRSAAIRFLVDRGLDAVNGEESRAAQ